MPTTITIDEFSIDETESEFDEDAGVAYLVYYCSAAYQVNGRELVATATACDNLIELEETGITATIERELGLSDDDLLEIGKALTKGFRNWFRLEMMAEDDRREACGTDPVSVYGREGFADPGGNSALRAETSWNPRVYPCPSCDQPNRLTEADMRKGYQCDACANLVEGCY